MSDTPQFRHGAPRAAMGLAFLVLAAACSPGLPDASVQALASTRAAFPVAPLPGAPAPAPGDFQLPDHWDLGDISIHGVNHDLVLAYHGEGGPWEPPGAPPETGSEVTPGRALGLDDQRPVVTLARWYQRPFGDGPVRLVGQADGKPAAIDLEPALALGRRFEGTDGPDLLQGSPGDDRLNGRRGEDVLTGGPGDDTYVVAGDQGIKLILDEAGSDSVEFAPGIGPGDLALRQEARDLAIEVQGSGVGTYLVILQAPGDAAGIENFRFGDGTVLGLAELADQVTAEAPDPRTYAAKVLERTTVTLSLGDADPGLVRAVQGAALLHNGASRCLELPLHPRPDELVSEGGLFSPESFQAVFRGPAATAEREEQLRKLAVLAAVGVLADEPVPPADGQPAGVRYTFTWEGWADSERQPCIRYGDVEVLELISYRPAGRQAHGAEVYRVQVKVGVRELAPWARQRLVTDAFPQILRDQAGTRQELRLGKRGEEWFPLSSRRLEESVLKRIPPRLPTGEELAGVLTRNGQKPDWAESLCGELPMLGESTMNPAGTEYQTAQRLPITLRGEYRRMQVETQAQLDALVALGVARRFNDRRTYPRGDTHPRIVYAVGPPQRVFRREPFGRNCLHLGESRFEVLSVRPTENPNRVWLKGRWTAEPAYDWLQSPAGRRLFPKVAAQLQEGQAVSTMLAYAGGRWQVE